MIFVFSGKSAFSISKIAYIGLVFLFLLLYISCAPDLSNKIFEPGDILPPVLLSWSPTSSRSICFTFDENISCSTYDFLIDNDLLPLNTEIDGTIIKLEIDRDQEIGKKYTVSGSVKDNFGNTTNFIVQFTGFNPRVPSMLINEVLCEGSSTHPDLVELKVLTEGNLAGTVFIVGMPGAETVRYDFPSAEVKAGEFIVLHLKPSGDPGEIDEIEPADISTGLDTTPSGRDFWYRETTNSLPNANGVLSIHTSIPGTIMDAIAYSERTSDSDINYAGFGTQAFRNAVEYIVNANAWKIQTEVARPEDCVPSNYTTSTRTICRSSSSTDIDSASDWHTVPTSGFTIGAINKDEIYSP